MQAKNYKYTQPVIGILNWSILNFKYLKSQDRNIFITVKTKSGCGGGGIFAPNLQDQKNIGHGPPQTQVYFMKVYFPKVYFLLDENKIGHNSSPQTQEVLTSR